MHNLFCCTLCILSWKHITIPSYHFFHYVIFFFCCFLRQINLWDCLPPFWLRQYRKRLLHLPWNFFLPFKIHFPRGVVKQGPSVWYVHIPRYVQVPNRYLWTYYVQGTSAEMTGNDWNILHVPDLVSTPTFPSPFFVLIFSLSF